jgi:hypothetical protein
MSTISAAPAAFVPGPGRPRLRRRRLLAAGMLLLAMVAPAQAQDGGAGELSFFDPVLTITPGITRELNILFDHARASDGRLTLMSAKLQYPVLDWLQFSLEMPVLIQDPDVGEPATGPGDLVLAGQASVFQSLRWKTQLDVGVELLMPTGSGSVLAGSTAVRPFAIGGIKLGPLDLITNLSYQWVLAGPVSGVQLFQANAALGWPLDWVAPFVELNLIKPVQGVDDRRPQIYVLPGLEIFLPWNLSLSAGVQLPLTSARFFDQRVLGLLKWVF